MSELGPTEPPLPHLENKIMKVPAVQMLAYSYLS